VLLVLAVEGKAGRDDAILGVEQEHEAKRPCADEQPFAEV
jgi:hypothetical protein